MLQFTEQEIHKIRSRSRSEIIQSLIDNNQTVLYTDTLIPPDARATWNLYYFCPEHGVRLTWDRFKPTKHTCPVDGKIFSEEPYDGAWWRWLNGLNAKACNDLGLLWQLTAEDIYLEKVREILLGYADVYPDYEPHGGIPYNGPGKANAQTLCEANCHLDFARGYDYIRDELNENERRHIEQNLLLEGAEFLMEHRSDQLHNHEMKISGTIGVIGLLLDDTRIIDFALNSKYGLKYQLEHGIIGEGLWFEGSIHYHYYALQALMGYELMARNSVYSLKSHPNFHRMLAFPLNLIMADGLFPRLNDCIAGQEVITHSHLFEYAYREFRDPLFARALASIYQNQSRNNIDALLYGVSKLPGAEALKVNSIHAPGAGITICHDDKCKNTMLLKHAPYGGEHDHYDRLGLIIRRAGKEILPDLGTTGYGAELHYGYYKNSATHNTLSVEQENQPPAIPEVLAYHNDDHLTYIDTVVDWSKPHPGVDSHTIVQWDEEAYRDIHFRRSMIWLGNTVIQIDQIKNPHQKQLDLIWHIRGDQKVPDHAIDCENPLDGALARMHSVKIQALTGLEKFCFNIENEPDFNCFLVGEGELLTGRAPDNPATSDLSYLLLRSKEKHCRSVMVFDLDMNTPASQVDVSWQDQNCLEVTISRNETSRQFKLNMSKTGMTII